MERKSMIHKAVKYFFLCLVFARSFASTGCGTARKREIHFKPVCFEPTH